MRLDEITKDEFKNKLKYPMPLVEELRGMVKTALKGINRGTDLGVTPGMSAEYEEEFGDDFVAWTIKINLGRTLGPDKAERWVNVFRSAFSVYKADGVTVHELNKTDDYVLIGIQLDI